MLVGPSGDSEHWDRKRKKRTDFLKVVHVHYRLIWLSGENEASLAVSGVDSRGGVRGGGGLLEGSECRACLYVMKRDGTRARARRRRRRRAQNYLL